MAHRVPIGCSGWSYDEWRGGLYPDGLPKRRRLERYQLAYLRLHYGHRGRGGNYSEAELDDWRRRTSAWRSRRPVFVYLNNDWKGYAPANARPSRVQSPVFRGSRRAVPTKRKA